MLDLLLPKILGCWDSVVKNLKYGCKFFDGTLMRNKFNDTISRFFKILILIFIFIFYMILVIIYIFIFCIIRIFYFN